MAASSFHDALQSRPPFCYSRCPAISSRPGGHAMAGGWSQARQRSHCRLSLHVCREPPLYRGFSGAFDRVLRQGLRVTHRFAPDDRMIQLFYRYFSLEAWLVSGFFIFLIGLGIDIAILNTWIQNGFKNLNAVRGA